MLITWLYTITSVIIVSLISLIGVVTLGLNEKTLKKTIIYLVSFSAGALFGAAFLDLLPEAVSTAGGFTKTVSFGLLAGILVFFIVEKFIHWRHCHLEATKKHIHPVGFLNLFGDGVHNFIDGLVIAATFLVSIPLGIVTTIAVLLHEIPQEMGDFGVLLHAGFTKSRALFFNFLSALTAVAGAIVGLLIGARMGNVTLFLIPFAAGGFIYIAGSDLIPEMHKCEAESTSKSFWQFAVFVLGIAIMLVFVIFE